METPYNIDQKQARRIFAGLAKYGYLYNNQFLRWWETFCDFESEYFKLLNETGILKTQKLTWHGTLGELGFMATELYGVDRWKRLEYFYKLPNGKLNVRAVQATLSRIGHRNLPDKYPHLAAIFEGIKKRNT
jgi:hypothetical protein